MTQDVHKLKRQVFSVVDIVFYTFFNLRDWGPLASWKGTCAHSKQGPDRLRKRSFGSYRGQSYGDCVPLSVPPSLNSKNNSLH